ncbi:IS4 family transposase [Leptolyngbya iicbica]|uniref:IS4 family transposase n=2 Tax=Cyanophyceae TaxID=3028117 RepID=A0A4Q7E4F3_9CYAN|nr:IS4 family transposase [Leptolyngbya sp. LK]RZM76653.1 IS4 family transposase [Leptolyngbya sp. LK]RZM77885.1 IS4 family transposase [Leptolyngbya sp. LK]RZM81811.1 IS4 family transposase [Leptolyngbya sp. LK]
MGNSFRQTVAGLFAKDEMNSSTMLSGHVAATRARAQASESEYLIAAQDTTYYNYSGQAQMSGLGVIQGQVRGLMQHNVLLMDEGGLPLGIVDQQYWTRGGAMDWPTSQKESQKWFNGLAAVNQQAQGSDKRWVVTGDRESDIFDFFKAECESNVDLLVRVFQPRRVEVVTAGVVCPLPTVCAHLDDYGNESVQIERLYDGKRRTVELTLHLQAAIVHIHPNQTLSSARHKTQALSLVVATEVACCDVKSQADCFETDNSLSWFLLTSLPITQADEVQRIVRFYALRWRIERLHFTLKSGALDVEKLQFDDVHTLTNALSFYSVVAWQLLGLTYALRQDPEQPAETLFEPDELTLLQQLSGKPVASLRQATLALTRLVGFAPSKKQPLPGVNVLATAIERFFFVKQGAAAVSKPLQD